MSPLKGQKIKDDVKDFFFKVRLDTELNNKLNETAEILGVKKSEVVRRGIESEYQKAKK